MIFRSAVLGLALAAIAAPASALVYTLNIRGHFEEGDGVVGPAFTASYRVDTAKNPYDGVTWTLTTGGVATSYTPPRYMRDDAPAPEHYYLYRDDTWAYASAIGPGGFVIARGHEVSDNVYDPGENFIDVYNHEALGLDFSFVNIENLIGPNGIPTTQKLGPDSLIEGYFSSARANNASRWPDYRGPYYAFLRGTSFSVSVPEPSIWALMIGGFGFTGTALRRSRLKTLAAS